jgi:hypothetical protein
MMNNPQDRCSTPALFPPAEPVADGEVLTEATFYPIWQGFGEGLRLASGPGGRTGFFRPPWNPFGPCNEIALHGQELSVIALSLVSRTGYQIQTDPGALRLSVQAGDTVYAVLSGPKSSAGFGDGCTVDLAKQPPAEVPERWQIVEPLADVVEADGQLRLRLLPAAMTPHAVGVVKSAHESLRKTLAACRQRLAGTAAGRAVGDALNRTFQVSSASALETLVFEAQLLQLAAYRFPFEHRPGTPSPMPEPVPALDAATDQVVTFLNSLERLFAEGGPLEEPQQPPAPAPVAPPRPSFPWRTAGRVAVLTAGLLGIAGLIGSCGYGVRHPESGRSSLPMPRATVAFGKDKGPLLPGQLREQNLDIAWDPADDQEVRARARVYWRLTRAKDRAVIAEGFLAEPSPEQLFSAVSGALGPDELPAHLSVGLGYPPDDTEPARPPKDADLVVVRLGFPSVPGLRYPAGVPDQRDAAGRWYAVAVRPRDGANVSVYRVASGWQCVDRSVVTVQAYFDRFLPAAAKHLVAAAAERGGVPEAVATFRGLARSPIDGLERLAPAPAPWAEAVVRGSLLFDPDAPPADRAYRGYPTPALRGFADIAIDLTKLPGQTTDSLPLIGVSHTEAEAYARWVSEAGGAWKVADTAVLGPLAGSPRAPAAAPLQADDARGVGPRGLFFACGNGNVLEFVGFDPRARKAMAVGHAFSGAQASAERPLELDPYARPLDVSFRLAQFVEDK